MLVNEASFLSTGFSTYGLEVLRRWHESGKYELFEYGSYGQPNDSRGDDLPWQYMTAMPDPNNQKESQLYYSIPTNQFGDWKFEEACLRFKPDIVCDIRDWWMLEFEERSPFRGCYKWAIMPTVDAEPQDEQWISTYLNANAVFTYSDWAYELLRKQTNGRVKLRGAAPPGADVDTYRVRSNKVEHRKNMGVDPDCYIVGTVMRNQRRKLYPDLIEAFAEFLAMAPTEMAKKTYLYLHTSWPDVGWDLPRLIREAGVGSRCLFTYFCKSCGAVFTSFFQDARGVCQNCGKAEATFPNSHLGVSRSVLNEVFGLFDCYVQYANSEGFGMPQVEAAACGVPVFATDYSAMSDVVRKLKGMPIKVQRLAREPETHCYRALPDNSDFVKELIAFLLKPEALRARMGFEARKAVEKHYSWDQTAQKWMDYFDEVEVNPEAWNAPARIHKPATQMPNGMSNEEFVRWGIVNVAGRPDLLNSYMAIRMTRDLNWGATVPHTGGIYFNEGSMLGTQPRFQPFDREIALKTLMELCEQTNQCEMQRVGK